MAKTIKEERLRWVLPIVKGEIKLVDVSKVCPHGKRSLERWVSLYKTCGETSLEPKSTRPKTNPNETPIEIKERIISLRKETKLCAKKLKWKLEKANLNIHERTIGKILKTEGLVRKYRVKKVKIKYVKIPLLPGELMEIDVKYVPETIQNKEYFQYTAIDCSSRWRHLEVYNDQNTETSIRFLKRVISIFPHRIRSVKTDNGAIFTNYYVGTNKRSDMSLKTIHGFDIFCRDQGIIHYLIDPGKPAQNGKVERSHRTDREEFWNRVSFSSLENLAKKQKVYLDWYNDEREHLGINGLTPREKLKECQI